MPSNNCKFLFGLPPEWVMINTPIMNLIPAQEHMKMMALLSPIALFLQGVNLKKLNIPTDCKSNGLIIPNSDQQIYRYYVHGDVTHKPNIQQLDGKKVIFADGSTEEIDLIIYATGYKIEFSFIDKSDLNWQEGTTQPNLYMNVFHPEENNLFVIGIVHPTGTQARHMPQSLWQQKFGFSLNHSSEDEGDTASRSEPTEVTTNISLEDELSTLSIHTKDDISRL